MPTFQSGDIVINIRSKSEDIKRKIYKIISPIGSAWAGTYLVANPKGKLKTLYYWQLHKIDRAIQDAANNVSLAERMLTKHQENLQTLLRERDKLDTYFPKI